MDGKVGDFHVSQRDANFTTFIVPATHIAVSAPGAWLAGFSLSQSIKRLSDRVIPYTPGWRW